MMLTSKTAEACCRAGSYLVATTLLAALCWLGAHAADAVVSPEQSAAHVGERTCVRGPVANVYISAKGNVFINFGRRYPNQTFTATVFVGDTGKFSDLTQLAGQTVEVCGEVNLYHGKPEIILRDSGQIVTRR